MADTNVPAAPTATEAVAPETAATPNPQMEAFARKERQLRKMQTDLQSERQRLEAESTKYKTDYIPKSRFQEDPLSLFAEMGYDTEKLSQLLIDAPNANDPTVRMFQQKIKALEEKQNAAEKRAVEATQAQYDQAKKQIANEARMLVDSSSDYETIKSAGMHDAVTEWILQTFEESGVLMDVAEAARQVEEKLVDEGMKYAKIPKVQQRMQPVAPAQTKPAPSQQPQIRTITQNLTQQTSSGKSMTAAEKRARAIAAFQGTLKG